MPLIYSILCNNRSFSLISRYKTTYKSYLRMVTDQPEAWTNAKPRTSLEVGAPQAFWWSAPCWPEEQADGQPQPCLPLEVSSSGNGGRGIILVPVQWNLTLTLRKFSGLLPEKNRPISGGLRKGLADLDDCGSVGYCDCVSGTDILLHSMPFQSYPPAFSLLYTPLNQPSN